MMGQIIQLIDSNTKENVNYEEVTTWYDGSIMDDTKVDNVIFRKKGESYYKRAYSGAIMAEWFYPLNSNSLENIIKNKTADLGKTHFEIDRHIRVENVDDISIYGNGAVISDSMRNVTDKTGVDAQTPNGIIFYNCKNVTIKGDIKFVSNALRSGELPDAFDHNSIFPCLMFDNCENLNIELTVDGNLGAWPAYSITHDPNMDIDIVSRFCMVTIRHSNNIRINKFEMLQGCGLGEHLTLYDCANVQIKNHNCNNSYDAWSFAKIIKCKNVISQNGSVKSEMTGNGWDISGSGIKFENIDIDNPVDKDAFDITSEYGINGGDTEDVTFSNIKCNRSGVVGVVNLNPSTVNLKTKRVILDNIRHTPAMFDKNTTTVSNINIENLTLSNSYIEKVSRIVSPALHQETLSYVNLNPFYRDMKRNVYINNIECKIGDILPDLSEKKNTTGIEIAGYALIKDSTFKRELDSMLYHSLLFVDCYGHEIHGIHKNDLSESPTKIDVENCVFEGLNIYAGANINFTNCRFINCAFYELSTKNGGYKNHYTRFIHCDFNYINSATSITSTNYFRLDNIACIRCVYCGISKNPNGNPVFTSTGYSDKTSLVLNDCTYNLQRDNTGGGYNLMPFVNIFTSRYKNVTINGSLISTPCILVGFNSSTADSNLYNVTVVNNNFTSNVESLMFDSGNPSLNGLKSIVMNNLFQPTTDNRYSLRAIEAMAALNLLNVNINNIELAAI